MNSHIIIHIPCLILLGIATLTDIRARAVIPQLNLMAIGSTLIIHLLAGTFRENWLNMLLGGVGIMALMLPIYVLSRGGLGGGDVKLFITMGMLLGFSDTLYILLVGMILALGYGGISGNRQKIPLCPFVFFSFSTRVWGIDRIIADVIKLLL